jgi:hypothetical protein
MLPIGLLSSRLEDKICFYSKKSVEYQKNNVVQQILALILDILVIVKKTFEFKPENRINFVWKSKREHLGK